MSKGYELIADGLKMMAKGYEMLGKDGEKVSPKEVSSNDSPKMEAPKETSDLPKEEHKPEVKKVDVKEVRALMREKIKAGKMEECQEALHSFGCDKLTDVPADSLSELLAKVEVL